MLGERGTKAKDPVADEFLRVHREFHRILRQPQFLFNVKAWAPTQETAHLLASTAAESSFEEGTYRLLDYDTNSNWFERSRESSNKLRPFLDSRCQEIWDSYDVKGLFRLAHMTSVDEFKGMFRFPVTGYSPPCCLWKSTDYHKHKETKDYLLIGHALSAGDDWRSEEIKPGPLSGYLDVSSPVKVAAEYVNENETPML